jgi:hypothetical protein
VTSIRHAPQLCSTSKIKPNLVFENAKITFHSVAKTSPANRD